MKIAIVCGAGIVSGKEVMALELGHALRSEGHSITFITSMWGDGEFYRRLISAGIPASRMRIGFISLTPTPGNIWMTADQLYHWPKLQFDYTRFLRRERPDRVIHTNWHHVLMLWPHLRQDRDIYWCHEIHPLNKRYSSLFCAMANKMGRFVAVSNAAGQMIQRLGVPEDKIRIVHNGVAPPDVAFSSRATRDGLSIGIVGQVGAWKGHQDLLAAFARIAPAHPKAALHIIGAGSAAFIEQLMSMAAELNISDRCVWRGFVNKRSEIYGSLDICVVPSRRAESFGLAALEPAFCAIPVVATRVGGLAEIVLDGKTGFLVDPNQPEQLFEKISALLSDPELRKRMGTAAQQRAHDVFSLDRFVKEFVKAIDLPMSRGAPA